MEQFSVGTSFSEGWRVMKANYGVLLGASLVYLLIAIGMGIIPCIGPVASFFISPPLVAGWVYMGVKAYRGNVEFRDLFSGFQRYASTLGIYWLLVLIMLPAMIPAGIGFGIGMAIDPDFEGPAIAAVALGGIATLLLALFLGVRLGFSMVICLDQDLGAIESIGRSWKMTAPWMGTLIGLSICMGILQLVLMLLLYLPSIFLGMPLGLSIMGAAYCLMTGGGEAAGAETPPESAGAQQP